MVAPHPLVRATDFSAWQRRIARALKVPRKLKPRTSKPGQYPTADRISSLGSALGATDYLELGLHAGITFERVSIARKWGVDPAPRFRTDGLPAAWEVFAGTSDAFFESNPELRFDITFVDGWHDFGQATRDLVNSLHHSRSGGLVLIDDVLPGSAAAASSISELASTRDQVPPGWAGDVFRLVYLLSLADPNGDHYRTIDGEGPVQTLVFDSARRLNLVSRFNDALSLEWHASWLTVRPTWMRAVPSLEEALHDRERGWVA
jgi:hypothetical protein